MGKLLLVAAAVVLVATWIGGGGHGCSGVSAAPDRPVVFAPDLVPEPPSFRSVEAPPCTHMNEVGGEMCEEDPDYNDTIKKQVLNLLSRDTSVNALLTDQQLRSILSDPDKIPIPKDTIHTRLGVSETPVCAAQETIIRPKRAKTSRDDWVFVLNQEGVEQALRVEKCISDGSTCNIGSGLPGGAKASCRQKYVYRRLLVLGTNKIEPEEVLMPSCCVCYTTYQDLVLRSRNITRSSDIPAIPSPEPAVPAFAPMNPSPFNPMTLNFGRQIGFPGNG